MYLVFSIPDLDYAAAVSHELWMVCRPRSVSAEETSQYLCGTFMHGDSSQVAIGPINLVQPVHPDADELALVDLINPAITADDRQYIIDSINTAKGGVIDIQAVIEATTLASNLRTISALTDEGWFPEIEGI